MKMKFSLPVKIALFSLVLTLIGVTGVAFVTYNYSDDVLQKQALQGLSQKVNREGAVLSQVLQTIREDARFLVDSPSSQGIGRALGHAGFDDLANMTVQMWNERLASQLRTVLTQRDIYYQLRLIGLADHGREMIRIERIGDSVEVAPEHELQQKERRDYFQQGVRLAAGEMHLSEITLNREHGEITYPPRPMLRVVTPLHDQDGKLFALLVINAGLNQVAAGLDNAPEGIFYFIANDRGDYLFHPDKERAMAFEYDRRARIQDDYPSISKALGQMKSDHSGQLQSFDLPDQGIGLSLRYIHFDPGHPERFFMIGAVEKLSSLSYESLRLRNNLLLIVAIMALLLALVTFLVVRHITAPILHLKEAVDQVSAGEDDALIPVEGHDEIASLARSFRDMLKKLSASRAELRQSNVMLEQQNVDLAGALEQAKAAALAKSRFLATMSHEIRTPLNGVLGLTELVLGSELSAEQRENLETVSASGQTLLTILNDVLDFSKMEAGQFELNRSEFSPNDLIELSTRLYSKEAHGKGIELISGEMPKLTFQLIGDADRLRQILLNLLSNAIKFTDSGEVLAQVESLREDETRMQLRFSVNDTGIGISREDQSKLFTEFSQLDASSTRKYGGTGLGLSIASKLVSLMGGELFVESEAGKGARFWFDIELEKGGRLPDAAVYHEDEFSQWRVLVVDDNATNLKVLHHMVTSWGMRNGSVKSGKAALKRLLVEADRDDPYHIALIDHMMPEMDGMELARRIRQETVLADLKVIMLSSLDMVYDEKKKKDYGLNAFLRKPIHQSTLFNRILAVMGESVAIEANQHAVQPGREERILLAEDVPMNQRVAVGMLNKLGLSHVDIAHNGAEAVDLFECDKYALILMDIRMPDMDGCEATRKIRAIEQAQTCTARTPIIALTAHAFAEDKQQSLEAGMDDLITKPLTGGKLTEVMFRWLPVGKQSGAATLDMAIMQELRQTMDDGMVEILDMYKGELPLQIEEICQALRNKDAGRLQKSTHRLQGTSRNIGALALAEMCEKLGAMAENMDADMSTVAVDRMVQLIRDEKKILLKALDELRAEGER